ncbi:hypothetical protein HPB50_014874 [Hyalomma asiaticum]|uniref:Uncharacterized protein n=1 Tax=Hyalomma asiaticum TaxID=266040 RepID=A0ACB7SJW8_HYAAI|nr:hypothetical protein HPB50_014874 [Hyalomma asiaticum]
MSSLVTHWRSHTGERPYGCELCPVTFGDVSCYSKHKFVHSGDRPYTCFACDKSFTQSGNLYRHECLYVLAQKRPYGCELCPATFGDVSCYSKHKFVHSGDRPYTCFACDKSFTQSCKLHRHERDNVPSGPPQEADAADIASERPSLGGLSPVAVEPIKCFSSSRRMLKALQAFLCDRIRDA